MEHPLTTIDLNADLGEDCGDDAAMLTVVTSANIACGLHAGGPLTIRKVTSMANQAGVRIGAHPSYPDRANFGRVSMTLTDSDFRTMLAFQMGGFTAVAGEPLYIKAHGALYNDLMVNRDLAAVFMDVLFDDDAVEAAVMGLPGSALADLAVQWGVPFIAEAFADRAYLSDGTLAPRAMPGAVLHEADVIAARAMRMATQGEVVTIDGKVIEVRPDSLCVHGDTPGAVEIAKATRAALSDAGVTIKGWSA